MPWGIILELHGWWHILTAISAYCFMAMIEFLTASSIDEAHSIGFAWPAKLVLGGLDLTTKDMNGVVSKEE
jgi:dihydroceramidase